jgi:hypothetical protein
MADVLNRGMLRDLLTGESNIDPTAAERGKVIVVAMPLKEYGQVGLYAAALWKFAFQKSIERRNVAESPRPVLLWQDEGQYYLSESTDFPFTSTSRSARVANVLLTQSISGVVATLGGGPAGKAEADAHLSNYGTKIFHANTDAASNEYAANLIGRRKQFRVSANNNYGNDGFAVGYSRSQQTGGSSGINEVVGRASNGSPRPVCVATFAHRQPEEADVTNEENIRSAGPLALAPRDAARALGVSERTLWTYTRRHGVPHVRLGRRILYPVRELADWLARRAATETAAADAGR